jgi:thioredoxin reductase (NADPH)
VREDLGRDRVQHGRELFGTRSRHDEADPRPAGQHFVVADHGHLSSLLELIRHGDLGRDMSRYLADRIERNPGIEVLLHAEVRELVGDRVLEALIVENNQTGERRRLEARDLFVFIGAEPHTRWLGDELALDDRGYILTGRDAARPTGNGALQELGHEPYLLETSWPGVFAAGDVRSGSIKRVASAVGEGAMAVRFVHARLEGRTHLE